jgi:membrane protease YdiL (CAAX protease family)
VIGTAITLSLLPVLGISHAQAAHAVGIADVSLFRLALYGFWAVATAIALTMVLFRRGVRLEDLGWRGSLSLGKAAWAALAALAALAVWFPVDAVREVLGIPLYWVWGQEQFVMPRSTWEFFVAGFVGLLLVPLAEETLFRGHVLQALRARMHPFSALLLHNALFAVYHLGVGPGLPLYIFFLVLLPCPTIPALRQRLSMHADALPQQRFYRLGAVNVECSINFRGSHGGRVHKRRWPPSRCRQRELPTGAEPQFLQVLFLWRISSCGPSAPFPA